MVAVTFVELACAAIKLGHHDSYVAPSIAYGLGFYPSQNTRAETPFLNGGKHPGKLQIGTAEPIAPATERPGQLVISANGETSSASFHSAQMGRQLVCHTLVSSPRFDRGEGLRELPGSSRTQPIDREYCSTGVGTNYPQIEPSASIATRIRTTALIHK